MGRSGLWPSGRFNKLGVERIIHLKRNYTFSLRISNLNVITFAIAQDTKKTKINDTETTHRTFKRIVETAT